MQQPLTARELLGRIEEHDGRVYRLRRSPGVFVLTTNEKLVSGLLKIGGSRHASCPVEGYRRGEKREWDIWITSIPVAGEETIWEAAAA